MKQSVPAGPLMCTVCAIAAINLGVAAEAVQLAGRPDPLGFGQAGALALAAAGTLLGWLAVAGWRKYLRARRLR